MSQDEEEIVEWLKKSREQQSEFNPVIMTPDGIVVDGKHRLQAYPGWKVQIVNLSKREALRQRIHRNVHRRVPREERQAQLLEYALHLEDEGVKPHEMISALAKEIPFSENYIRRLMPAKYKRDYIRKPQIGIESQIETPKFEKPSEEFLEEFQAPCLSCAKSESCDRIKSYASPAEPGKLFCDEYVVKSPEMPVEKPSAGFEPTVPKPAEEKPQVQPSVTAKPARLTTVTCPYCHVDLQVVLCSKCWKDLHIKELFKET